MGGRLGCELVVAQANANLTTCELEAVELCERFLGIIGIGKPVG